MNSAPDIYLICELADADAAAAIARLNAALTAAPVASVLLRAAAGATLDAGLAKTLTTLAQKRDVAVLIDGDAALARMIKADGVHLAWSKDPLLGYRAAREILGAHAMIGADAGRSRDAAMELGEEGADYIAFGIPAHVEDRQTAEARQCDLIQWWSEIFEVPCVAFDVASQEQAVALARASADFLTVTIGAELSADQAARQVTDLCDALRLIEAPA